MELRFILEHTEASVQSARKMFNAGERERCSFMLEALGNWLQQQYWAGVLTPPNIDVKPGEPEK